MSHRRYTPYLFILPALAMYALFVVLPIADSLRMSLLHWSSPLLPPEFCGLDNFRRLMSDSVFWHAAWHNLLLLTGSLLLQLPLAMAIALLLHQRTIARGLFRTAFFAPMMMPTAAIAVLWQYLYEPESGLLSSVIRCWQSDFVFPWLSDPGSALLWIFVTICWQYTGFHMVLYLAGLSTIPNDYYEAARIDGANEWQICWHIALPALRPTIAISATLSIIGSLKYFDLIYLMGGGLPEKSREVMATYIYRLAFEQNQGRYGYGSAAAVCLFVLALAVVIPLQARQLRTAS
ncbi:MAG: sugar ABC transporter permease [Lentisphaeria bacterium]|nr:sugar ABC transporter permease [Lentisphaeria bacterium]